MCLFLFSSLTSFLCFDYEFGIYLGCKIRIVISDSPLIFINCVAFLLDGSMAAAKLSFVTVKRVLQGNENRGIVFGVLYVTFQRIPFSYV